MKSIKLRLEFNNKQETLAMKHCGVARHAYNWGLDVCKKAYANGESKPSAIDLHKKLIKEVKSENAWYYEVSKFSPQQSLRNLDIAYDRFFKKTSEFPKYKKRGNRDRFYLEGKIEVKGNRIKLPKFGWIRISESRDYERIKNVVVSKQGGRWFVAFKVEREVKYKKQELNNPIGVDLGIKTLATLSDGKVFANVRPYKVYKRKLKIFQRKVSKKYVEGAKVQSNNYKKAVKKVGGIHYKISSIRKDNLHKLTTYLAKNHSEVVIEDLNVRGMSKNHKLASAILDGGFYEFRRQLGYKCAWYGSMLTVTDRCYASSKTCSCCGSVNKDLRLSDRIYRCGGCGFEMDRDLNASKNLVSKSVSYTALMPVEW